MVAAAGLLGLPWRSPPPGRWPSPAAGKHLPARAGKCLPATGQGRLPGGGDLQSSPRGPAAATICLKPKAAWGTSQKLTYEETGKLEPGAGQVRRPHDKLRQHLRRAEARPGWPRSHGVPPIVNRALTTAQGTASMATVSHYRDHRVLARAAPAALGRWGVWPCRTSFSFLCGQDSLRRSHGNGE